MAENEMLDMGHARNGRWQKWRDSIIGQGSVSEIANEGVRCLARTFKNLQQLFENENGVPLREVLNAATGDDGNFDDIMRRSRYGRDYLQMFACPLNHGLDDRTVVENVLSFTVDRFLDQIREDAVGVTFDDAKTFREFGLKVKDRMIDGIQNLSAQLADAPDRSLRMPGSLRQRRSNSSVMVSTTLRDPPPMNRQEVTQRSRSFLFAALGGVVAGELGVDRVEVYENGVGVINLPPMTGMLFGSRATRSAHPEFFRRMSALLSAVSQRPIEFDLPFRNKTKAELIQRIASDDLLANVARQSVSCIHYPRRVRGTQKQCGVCPGCIGRRQAMMAGGVSESPNEYGFNIFGTATEVAAIPAENRDHLKAIISQVEFLSCVDSEDSLPLLVRAHFANVLEPTEDRKPTLQLLQKYRNEWLSFIEAGVVADRHWARWHGPVSSSSARSVA
jgi:hypothetical protein